MSRLWCLWNYDMLSKIAKWASITHYCFVHWKKCVVVLYRYGMPLKLIFHISYIVLSVCF